MSFWKIAWRNMRQRALASSLTGLSMALAVAVMICVMVIHGVAVRQFTQDAQGYHLIVGSGKGSPLELVLTTVFHVGKPLYPIPYSYYREFTDGRFAPYVEVAVPYCLGDSYAAGGKVYRVVATTPDLFNKIAYAADDQGELIYYRFADGRNFKNENCYEGVIGSVVAAQSGLEVGDRFNPTHGIGAEGDEHGAFVIVGVLQPTGTANDRAVFINIEGFLQIEDHQLAAQEAAKPGEMAIVGADVADRLRLKRGDRFTPEQEGFSAKKVVGVLSPSDPAVDGAVFLDAPELRPEEAAGEAAEEPAEDDGDAPAESPRGTLPPAVCYDNDGAELAPLAESQREVTSILVVNNSDLYSSSLLRAINKDPASPAQAVTPTGAVTQLLDQVVGPLQIVLMVLTVLIVTVAAISILVSIYNSMSERAHDIAVVRALGASRMAVLLIVLFESILLAVAGGAVGMLLGHAIVGLAAPYVVDATGIRLAATEFTPYELYVIPALVVLASLVGLLPALTAYRTDVAKTLGGAR